MRNTILGTVVCLAALAWMTTGTASASMVDEIKINLPCDASVGGVTLPAGEYTIRDMQNDGGASVMEISAYKGKSVFAIATEVIAPKQQSGSDTPKVMLTPKAEGGYQIQSIWLPGQEVGYEFSTR
jgi:hypothetical protein